jgi:hypothetical protein
MNLRLTFLLDKNNYFHVKNYQYKNCEYSNIDLYSLIYERINYAVITSYK